MYAFVVVRDGNDVAQFPTVDEAFVYKRAHGPDGKEQGDFVWCELQSTKYRAQVLRPG